MDALLYKNVMFNNISFFFFFSICLIILVTNIILYVVTVGCLGKRLGPSLLGRRLDSNVISEPLLPVYNCSISFLFFFSL
jgi:hypothetical protein